MEKFLYKIYYHVNGKWLNRKTSPENEIYFIDS